MKCKLEFYHIFGTVENLFNCKIKMFRSDGSKEFNQTSVHDLFIKQDIHFPKSCLTCNNRMR